MAAGDAVVEFSAVATDFVFKPAVGVEVCITSFMDFTGNQYFLTNDAGIQTSPKSATTSFPLNETNVKIFINNSTYWKQFAVAGRRTCLTGIQTK